MPPVRILVIEDHPDSLEILTYQLKSMGYEVIEATSGEEGIEKAKAYHPAIILMDLGLPDDFGRRSKNTSRWETTSFQNFLPPAEHPSNEEIESIFTVEERFKRFGCHLHAEFYRHRASICSRENGLGKELPTEWFSEDLHP